MGGCTFAQILTLIQGSSLESYFLFLHGSKIAKFHFKAAFKVTSLIDMEGGGGGLSLTLDGKATLKPSSCGTTNCE